MLIAGFEAYRRMGYLPEVPVWDALHSSLSAGSFSGLQSGLHLNMTRACGQADIGYCDPSVIDTPIDFLLNVWVNNSQFKVAKHSPCQSFEASIGYNTDRHIDQQHNWATQRP